MKSRITTRNGDGGEAMALNGERYPKSHPIMAAVGGVDELRGHTALLRQHILDSSRSDKEELAAFLLWILHTYFLIGSACSDPERKKPQYRQGDIGPGHVKRLEDEQSRMEQAVELPSAFIVTAANLPAAQADLTAAVTRRLERSLVELRSTNSAFEAKDILIYVNRLSDFFYMLGRFIEHPNHNTVDYSYLATGQTPDSGARNA